MNNMNDVILRRSWNQNLYDRISNETINSVLSDFIIPNSLTVDVGGNSGYQTFWHSQYNEVRTYEPIPILLKIMKKNLEQKKLHNKVTLINKAISDKIKKIDLFVDINRLSMTSQIPLVENVNKMRVEATSLDKDINQKVGFIKVDVEGFELEVLEGSRELIKKYNPHFMIEIYEPWCKKTGTKIENYFNFFKENKYKGFYYSNVDKKLKKLTSISESVNTVLTKHHEHDGDFLFMRD